MNQSPNVVLIAGWAQSETSLAPLADSLFGGRDSTSVRVSLTSTASLLAGSNRNEMTEAGEAVSEYASSLASMLARESRPSVLIGWSMGGMAALETAIHFPELVGRLVLLSSCAMFRAPDDRGEAQSLPVRALIVGMHRNRRETLEKFFSLVYSECGSPAQEEDSVREAIQLNPEHLVHGLRYIQGLDLRAHLPRVRAPALIVHGRRDRVISWEASGVLQKGIRGSRLQILDRGDHGLPLTAPALVASIIEAFLNGEPLLG